MRAVVVLSLVVYGAFSNPVRDEERPAVGPDYLDELLREERYEEFSFLMGLDHVALTHPQPHEGKRNPMFSEALGGDIIRRDRSPREEDRQALRFDKNPNAKWPNGVVPFTISKKYGSEDRRVIEKSIASWNRQISCVQFTPRTNEEDYVMFYPGDACFADLGRVGKQQELSLASDGCIYEDTILHEMEHAIGIEHEHNRNDRDDYVRVLFDNIPKEQHPSYKKTRSSKFRLLGDYDYYSLMHYTYLVAGLDKPAFEFLEEGVDKDKVGNAPTFTKQDKQKICQLYA